MIRGMAWVAAIVLHFGVPAVGALGWVFAASDLPTVPPWRHIDVWPIDPFNPLSLAQGSTEPEVDALFGIAPARRAPSGSDRCVRYQYSPRLAYVMLFREGTVDAMWLTEDGFIPYLCKRILVRTVRVPARAWYPVEGRRRTTRCS